MVILLFILALPYESVYIVRVTHSERLVLDVGLLNFE